MSRFRNVNNIPGSVQHTRHNELFIRILDYLISLPWAVDIGQDLLLGCPVQWDLLPAVGREPHPGVHWHRVAGGTAGPVRHAALGNSKVNFSFVLLFPLAKEKPVLEKFIFI